MFLYRWSKVIAWLILVIATELIAIFCFDLSIGKFWFMTTFNIAFWGLVISKCGISTNM